MATENDWSPNADGDWGTATNWSLGTVPTSSNNVAISTPDVHTITHNSGNDVVNKLTVGSTDHFVFNGGSLEILTTASFADGYAQYGGTLNANAVSITGPGLLLGGSSTGSTAFSIAGAISLANYTLGGATTLTNNATVNQTGQITLGDNSGVNAKITDATGSSYVIAGDFGISGGAASASLVNAGTLSKSSGSGTSAVNVSVTSTKTITATSGNLQFSGPTNTISGSVTGAGEVSFAGGATTLSATTVSVATLGLFNAASLTLGRALTYAGAFNDTSNGTTTVNVGTFALKLNGASNTLSGNFGSAIVTGSGSLTNGGTLTLSNALFGGTLSVVNNKTINQTGTVTFGDGSGNAPSFTNASAGTYTFTSDTNINQNIATVTFTNQGTLAKTGGTGVSAIAVGLVNAGTINVQSGVIEVDNSLVNTGTITGAGPLRFNGSGSGTLNSGTVLSVAELDLFASSTLNLGASLSYAGVFSDESDGTTHVNLGANTLTLSGSSNTLTGSFGTAVVGGSGTLANTGTLAIGNALLDATTKLNNTSTVNQVATVTIGGSGGQVASIVNAAAGTYNVAGAFAINNGAATTSHFDNSGHFNVAAGLNTATLSTTFNNLSGATVAINTGTLENDGTFINSGAISGTRFTMSNNSQTFIKTGTTLPVSEIDMFGSAYLEFDAGLVYAGTFNDLSSGTTTINLVNRSLSLTGNSTFSSSFGTDIITGAGTLKIGHASNFGGGTTEIGGVVNLDVASTITATGNLQIGDSSSSQASAVIDAGGKYNLVTDANVFSGASAASTLTNNGLFEKTAGTGTSVVKTKFVNNGTLTVSSGTVEFLAGTYSGSGTINGVQSTDNNGNFFVTHS